MIDNLKIEAEVQESFDHFSEVYCSADIKNIIKIISLDTLRDDSETSHPGVYYTLDEFNTCHQFYRGDVMQSFLESYNDGKKPVVFTWKKRYLLLMEYYTALDQNLKFPLGPEDRLLFDLRYRR